MARLLAVAVLTLHVTRASGWWLWKADSPSAAPTTAAARSKTRSAPTAVVPSLPAPDLVISAPLAISRPGTSLSLGPTVMRSCLSGKVASPKLCSPQWQLLPDCLSTSIPAWRAPYQRIADCFRCCLLAAIPEHRDAFWRAELNMTSHLRGTFSDNLPRADVLLASDSDLLNADIASAYGRGPDHHVMRDTFARYYPSHVRPEQNDALPFRHISIDATPDILFKIRHFLKSRELAAQREPFTLVTKSDTILPVRGEDEAILNDTRLAGYFTSNPSNNAHPKLYGFPRGIARPKAFRDALRTGSAAVLQVTRRRPHLLMAGCLTLNTDRSGSRKTKMRILTGNQLVRPLNCSETYHEMMSSKFVASFRGNGPNNCRDWEAIVAGSIPLVDYYHPLVPLFEELPVVLVKDWKAVTADALEDIWLRMQAMRFDVRKAYFPYWLWRLQAAPDPTVLS